MRSRIIHRYRVEEAGMIRSEIIAYGEENVELFTVQKLFERSNTVYATYKMLFAALRLCGNHGVTEVDIKTSHMNVSRELNGWPNPNARLLAIMRERLDETGITLGTVEYAVS